jgi:hypothetical protein
MHICPAVLSYITDAVENIPVNKTGSYKKDVIAKMLKGILLN